MRPARRFASAPRSSPRRFVIFWGCHFVVGSSVLGPISIPACADSDPPCPLVRDNREAGLIYIDGELVSKPVFADYPETEYCGQGNGDNLADLTIHLPTHVGSTITIRIAAEINSGMCWGRGWGGGRGRGEIFLCVFWGRLLRLSPLVSFNLTPEAIIPSFVFLHLYSDTVLLNPVGRCRSPVPHQMPMTSPLRLTTWPLGPTLGPGRPSTRLRRFVSRLSSCIALKARHVVRRSMYSSSAPCAFPTPGH